MPENYETAAKQRVFLRSRKTPSQNLSTRPKIIGASSSDLATPAQGRPRTAVRRSQRRCDLFQHDGANLYKLRAWREHRRRPLHMVRTGEDGQYCRNRCVRLPLRAMFFASVR